MPKMPEFHADAKKFPHETWLGYETALELVYAGAGVVGQPNTLTDEMKKAHLLSGLRGSAARFISLMPELQSLSYLETKQRLRSYFKRFGAPREVNLAQLQQRDEETIFEFVARLRAAVKSLNPGEDYVEIGKAKDDKKREDPQAELSGDKENVLVGTQAEVKERLARHRELSEGIILTFFLKGVRQEFKLPLRVRNPKTLKEAQEVAEEQEELMIKMNDDHQGSINFTVGSTPSHRPSVVVERSAKELQALNCQPQPDVRNPEKRIRTSRASRAYTPRERTPEPAAGRARSQDRQQDRHLLLLSITCYYCGKPGHFLRECKQKDRDLQEQRGFRSDRGVTTRRTASAPRDRRCLMDGGSSPSSPSGMRRVSARGADTAGKEDQHQGGQSRGVGQSTWTDNLEKQSKNGRRPTQRGGPTISAPRQRQ
jgi:hypothetical protein